VRRARPLRGLDQGEKPAGHGGRERRSGGTTTTCSAAVTCAQPAQGWGEVRHRAPRPADGRSRSAQVVVPLPATRRDRRRGHHPRPQDAHGAAHGRSVGARPHRQPEGCKSYSATRPSPQPAISTPTGISTSSRRRCATSSVRTRLTAICKVVPARLHEIPANLELMRLVGIEPTTSRSGGARSIP
jgi:hypothetical protein